MYAYDVYVYAMYTVHICVTLLSALLYRVCYVTLYAYLLEYTCKCKVISSILEGIYRRCLLVVYLIN